MRRDDLADLAAVVAVARAGSFTKAARTLGLSQSALSQIVSRAEARFELRLLTRTTRSVAPTEAGERLIAALGPVLDDLDAVVASLRDLRDNPSGTIRVTAVEHAVWTILRPALATILSDHPNLNVEVTLDYGIADVVADRFDAGIRLGGEVEKDMVAVRVGPDIPMAIVGSPAYFDRHPQPLEPFDLRHHRAINLRLPTSGTVNPWRMMESGRESRVRVEGQLQFGALAPIVDAALDGLGLAYVPRDMVDEPLRTRRLISVLDSFTTDLPGYHLYYPSRRHASAGFRLFVETLRYPRKVKKSAFRTSAQTD
ncbi:putative transcriptional regulator (LysR family) protein [Fulvimarina pelagi HTCC2506]|uniref:Putative transcriptional regulator (LysR family) protein n=1 Tax=Fulvimarina pelagi HTCC2506 TaxID=314231 RepID=Q0G7M2_9HYPH|nr:LysR family transcriptional regulator [Fulvimarina pelagi]EAU42342.1 putative transcriptional regulator (LysR family) protein [Fulvimarina pelagi HTCC2506]